MLALLFSLVACEDSDELVPLKISMAGKVAIPTASLIFLTIFSIALYFLAGRHLADDVPLDKVMIMEDSNSESINNESEDEESHPEAEPVILDEL
ncbi:hypothetical protein TVAG_165600 [Trichomonas vaginalis G3]|uniref:Uncharacterized protein n=1 Tax=Trichomonas vaginalis (strain ATCC PRA-98 / G3) TaxID=412133 RepID=A2DUP1_TRIV3|nr:hypothetical protein TVAGG3_0662630 [Trichomonas vaginalis G3]EAY15932.1 hypothetical protein TVAG_165600 [Trichomonas vaginalis G3]KAI5506607.1 hypothetical protein TVAGG3_0662630 [Trichomonas vaginalis G3]|eukprot:XP_001328155.1 hypothetical protein [Trichomonas vaginalis G3]